MPGSGQAVVFGQELGAHALVVEVLGYLVAGPLDIGFPGLGIL
jgi:hypothetical protein